MGASDDVAISIASDPAKAAEFFSTKSQDRQFGPGGGSVVDGFTHQATMAPSRHEYNGSVFDVGGGAPDETHPTTLQHQGYQWVTPQSGTTAFPANSFTGVANTSMAPPMQTPGGQPVPVRTQAQRDALPPGKTYIGPDGKVRTKGGPSPSGSGGFF